MKLQIIDFFPFVNWLTAFAGGATKQQLRFMFWYNLGVVFLIFLL